MKVSIYRTRLNLFLVSMSFQDDARISESSNSAQSNTKYKPRPSPAGHRITSRSVTIFGCPVRKDPLVHMFGYRMHNRAHKIYIREKIFILSAYETPCNTLGFNF